MAVMEAGIVLFVFAAIVAAMTIMSPSSFKATGNAYEHKK
jgi:hypothetical protein